MSHHANPRRVLLELLLPLWYRNAKKEEERGYASLGVTWTHNHHQTLPHRHRPDPGRTHTRPHPHHSLTLVVVVTHQWEQQEVTDASLNQCN